MYLWNVRNGDSVTWEACNPKKGHQVCWGKRSFTE